MSTVPWAPIHVALPTPTTYLTYDPEKTRPMTTPEKLTNPDTYNNAPLGTVVLDETGYAWQKIKETTTLEDKESIWATSDYARNQNGMAELPHMRVIHHPQTPLATTEDGEALPSRTIVSDKYGEAWQKNGSTWRFIGNETPFETLPLDFAPYTILHTPHPTN